QTSDISTYNNSFHLLTLKEKVSYMKPVNYGNMAFAVPAGMASSLAEPGREVISILGDGSMGMCLGELESVARSGSKQIVIVLNDGAYGNIRQEENFKFGPRYTGVDLTQLDFAEIARNAGMGGETIRKAEDLKAAIERAREHKGNYLINILFDGSYSVWPEAF
ncbi:MAG: thiamine pyrophosphate-binding protein, partial [Ruminococcaceae bacterium]|nr:thiamine pyrophosphate-binding protein [Oscillospiraceae bacterium]